MGLFDGTPLERPVRCEECSELIDACTCPPPPAEATGPKPADQSPRVRREKRRGKWTTVVAGLAGSEAELKPLLKQLRTGLGAGGGVSDGELVIQGDHRDAIVKRLVELGYRAKPAGG